MGSDRPSVRYGSAIMRRRSLFVAFHERMQMTLDGANEEGNN